MTVYVNADGTAGGLVLSRVTGYGNLFIRGDVTLEGPVNWKGLIISSGTITMNGTTGPINITGGVYVRELMDVAGSISLEYDSCAIKTAILSRPLIVTQWKQLL